MIAKVVIEKMATVKVEEGESLDHAIKKFKRLVEREGIIREFRDRVYYEKPSTILNRKKKALARKQNKKQLAKHAIFKSSN